MRVQLLSRSGISLERLKNFSEVAESSSIVKAAQGDLARQSLMSRQIRELEEFFGTELVKRQGRGITITEAGRQLAAISREFFNAMDDFNARAHELTVKLSMVAPNSINQWLILPRMGEIQKRLPRTRLSLFHEQTRDIVRLVQECVHDIGFVHEKAVPKGLKKQPLGIVTYSLFIPGSMPTGIANDPWKGLSSLPLALPLGGQLRAALEEKFKKKGEDLAIKLECGSYLDAQRAVQSGSCAAVLPNIAKVDLKEGTYLEIPLRELPEAQRKICLIWNPRVAEVRESVAKAVNVLSRMLVF